MRGLKLHVGMLLLCALQLPAHAQLTQEQQQKIHDDATAAARGSLAPGGALNNITEKGKKSLPNGALKAPPGTGIAAGDPYSDESAKADASVLDCFNKVNSGAWSGQPLSDVCEIVVSGGAVSSNGSSETAQLVADLCNTVVTSKLAEKTRLGDHCKTIVTTRQMMIQTVQKKQEFAKTNMNIGVKGGTQSGSMSDDLKSNYSACTSESQEVAPATMQEEICETERVVKLGNTCSKTLTTDVTWSCPEGSVVSGPTLDVAGTVDGPGRYTCQMGTPRLEYGCPVGTIGPTNKIIPPNTVAQPACTVPITNAVIAATLRTVMEDIVTKEATYKITNTWGDGCSALESNTPHDSQWNGISAGPVAAFDSSPNTQRCHLSSATCSQDVATTQLIKDVPIPPRCTQYTESFDCLTTDLVEQCEDKPKCTWLAPTDSDCLEWDNASSPRSCTHLQRRRSCEIAPAVKRDQTSCDKQTFCKGGSCWDTGYKANNEFGDAISLFSGAQQAGRYFNANDMQIFKGFSAACAHRDGGVLNCCKSSIFGDLLSDALNIGDKLKPPSFGMSTDDEKNLFNGKTFDYLYAKDSTGQLASGMRAISSMAGTASEEWKNIKNQDFKKALVTLYVTGPLNIAKTLASEGLQSAIDFYTTINTLGGLLKGCTDDDSLTKEKHKNNLCVDVGSHCNKPIPFIGGCWEREYRSCCFNSLLAKLINDGGRKSLMQKQIDGRLNPPNLAASLFSPNESNFDKRFGDGDNPNCRGFSLDQLKQIDFSKIDLKPFIATLNTKMPTKEEFLQRVTASRDGCPGGTAQCDGNTLETRALDKSQGPIAVDDKGKAVPRQYLSLAPIMRDVFTKKVPYGTPYGPFAINTEDWRLMTKFRFKEGEPPVTATVTPMKPYGPPADTGISLCKNPNYVNDGSGNTSEFIPCPPDPSADKCKVMKVEIRRARITDVWTDHRVPEYGSDGTIVKWNEGDKDRKTNGDEYNNGGIKELPGAYRGLAIPADTVSYRINYCADGSIPGVTQ